MSISDTLISFETAKLAKEKGLICGIMETSWYKPSGKIAKIKEIANYENYKEDFYYAPTQSLLQKWLREKHKIFIACNHSRVNDEEEVTLYDVNITTLSCLESYNFIWEKCSEDCYGETYEEALEKGLYESLKLIL